MEGLEKKGDRLTVFCNLCHRWGSRTQDQLIICVCGVEVLDFINTFVFSILGHDDSCDSKFPSRMGQSRREEQSYGPKFVTTRVEVSLESFTHMTLVSGSDEIFSTCRSGLYLECLMGPAREINRVSLDSGSHPCKERNIVGR